MTRLARIYTSADGQKRLDGLKWLKTAQNRMWQALYSYGEVFSTSDMDISLTQDTEFEINLKPGAQLVKQQARPLHPRMMADLED